jgi:hypothetical protein
MCVLWTFVANLRLVIVSCRCACSGLTMTNMSVFELPPSEYWRRYVNYSMLARVHGSFLQMGCIPLSSCTGCARPPWTIRAH